MDNKDFENNNTADEELRRKIREERLHLADLITEWHKRSASERREQVLKGIPHPEARDMPPDFPLSTDPFSIPPPPSFLLSNLMDIAEAKLGDVVELWGERYEEDGLVKAIWWLTKNIPHLIFSIIVEEIYKKIHQLVG